MCSRRDGSTEGCRCESECLTEGVNSFFNQRSIEGACALTVKKMSMVRKGNTRG